MNKLAQFVAMVFHLLIYAVLCVVCLFVLCTLWVVLWEAFHRIRELLSV